MLYQANFMKIRLVTNTTAPDDAPKNKKLRGYAFVVFEREQDMKGIVSGELFTLY
jgi:hypothetical protein